MDFYNLKKEELIREIKRLKDENDFLKESDSGFRLLFDIEKNCLFIINKNGSILIANEPAKKLFKLDDSNIKKNSLTEFNCSNGLNLKDNILNALSDNLSEFKVGVEIDNKVHTIECSAAKRDDSYILCIIKDITLLESSYLQLNNIRFGFPSLFDNTNLGINIIDENYKIVYVNNTFVKYNPNIKEFIGKNCFEVFHSSNATSICHNCPSEKTFSDGEIHSEIFTRTNPESNETRFFRIVSSPLKDDDGEIKGAVNIFEDITNIFQTGKKFIDRQSFVNNLIECLPIPIFFKNEKGIYLGCNKAFSQLFNVNKEEIPGKTAYEIYSKEDAEEYTKFDDEIINEGKTIQTQYERSLESENKKINFLLVKSYFYDADSNTKGIIGSIIDISELKKSRKECVEQKKFTDNIIEEANIMIMGLDIEGKVFLFNKMAENITGYTREEILGKNYFDIIVPKDKFPQVYESFINFTKSKIVKFDNFENYIYSKTGKAKFISWRDSALVSDNKVTGMISFGIDISNSKITEENVKKLTLAIQQTSDAIVITDEKGYIEYINPAFIKITGYNSEEVVGKKISILKSGLTDENLYKKLWETVLSGKTWFGEIRNKKKNGELYWENNSISPVKNDKGEITNFIDIKNDITSFKQSYEELKTLKEKTEESNKLKYSLLSNITREFRAPLISVLGYTEILQNELSDSWHLEMLEDINKNGKKLLRTLSLVLKLAKLESGEVNINLQKINLMKLLGDIISDFNQTALEKGLELSMTNYKNEVLVYSDIMMLKEIITNLIDNALKYTDTGFVKISFDKIFENNKFYAVLIVADSGIGISKEFQKVIFDEFRQESEGLSRKYEGSGLGLTISSFMAKLLNGNISLESERGKGSKFFLKIPLHEDDEFISEYYLNEQNDFEGKQNYPNTQDSKPNILLVEDNITNINIVEIFLQNLYNIDSTTTGEDAIAKTLAKKYDLIIMDINLGQGLNGIMTVQEIRKNKNYENTPIIAVTGYALYGDREKLLNSGFNEYLAKPFTRRQLVFIIKKFFDK